MGIKDLWSILTPYCERKPLYELDGKVIAIDLAGWVCESLNVVDYFVHPRQHLKNLFFRTCYLLLEGIIPLFVLEGEAPSLKHNVIAARGEIQFRGVKPKNTEKSSKNKATNDNEPKNPKEGKGRTRFNHVLKQCENLLKCMGLECIVGPGEAEAYCAFLNKCGLVEGVVSQDSDCFAYGAIKVYRNFSVSSGTNSAGQGGSIDVYDMRRIKEALDFGQNKIIVMALLCGCDYCPDGIEGVGRDSVLKLLKKYKEDEILSRIKSWRNNNSNYTALEMRINDKNICNNCGHLGKTQSHTKSGCVSCSSKKGCDSSLWKEQRLLIKAELTVRQKALMDPNFPSQEIIDEFLTEPSTQPKLNLKWSQPNLVKFIKSVGHLLQWTEIYCFQKFFPILTRWQIRNFHTKNNWNQFVTADYIKKKRVLKGIACYEIVWKDSNKFFDNLIPDDQIQAFIDGNPKGIEYLWSTIEPKELVEKAYPALVESFIASKEKKKSKKTAAGGQRRKKKNDGDSEGGINDLSTILNATQEIDKNVIKKTRKKAKPLPKGIQMITKFLIQNKENTPPPSKSKVMNHYSTPKSNDEGFMEESFNLTSLENISNDDDVDLDLSEIINSIVNRKNMPLRKFNGKSLKYDELQTNFSLNQSQDDMALIMSVKKENKRNSSIHSLNRTAKRLHLYRSLDDLHSNSSNNNKNSNRIDDEIIELLSSNESIIERNSIEMIPLVTHVDRFKQKINSSDVKQDNRNVSYFFNGNYCVDENGMDEFEKSLDFSFIRDSDSE